MNRRRQIFNIGLTLLLITVAGAGESKPVTTLEFSIHPNLYKTHFGRFGPNATKVVILERNGSVRLKLPGNPQGAKQAGMYSYFALAGDFEVSAIYEVISVPMPTTGYGAGFGLEVDTGGAEGSVAVRRGQWIGEGNGVQVIRSQKIDGAVTYETKFFATTAKKGKFVLRREKAEVVLLTADKPGVEPTELYRVPFTETTVRSFRVYADSGGSPTIVDGRISDLKASATEITGGIPERDRDEFPIWVVVASIVSAIILGLLVWYIIRRKGAKRASD